MKLTLIILMAFAVFQLTSCITEKSATNDSECANKQKTYSKIIDSIKHVYNSDIPARGVVIPELELIREIDSNEIKEDESIFFNVAAKDCKNNLFLLDKRASKIYKFNSEGKFIKDFLKKGEGPGEIRKPITTFKVSCDNVWASYVTEFCRFDTMGNFLEKKIFKKQYGLLEHVDENRFITNYDIYKEGTKNGRVCVVMDTEEHILLELYKKEDPYIGYSVIKLPNKDFEFVSNTSPLIGYTYNPLNQMIYVYYNFDYSISLLGLNGKIQKVIHKKHQDVEITDKEIKWILSEFKRMGWPSHYLDAYKKNPPEKYLPVIRKLCYLPNNHFAVLRSINYYEVEYDIFDSEGNFIFILKTNEKIPNLWDLYFFEDCIGVIIYEDEKNIYKEYKVKNLEGII